MAVVDWFDQQPGDRIIAFWTRGRIEGWTVGGEPYLTPRGVEAVKIDEERYYCTVEPDAGFLFDPNTDKVCVARPNGRVDVYKGKLTRVAQARRPRPARPLVGRPVLVAK